MHTVTTDLAQTIVADLGHDNGWKTMRLVEELSKLGQLHEYVGIASGRNALIQDLEDELETSRETIQSMAKLAQEIVEAAN
jgi:hypothetical protein